jgi:hypothetical protein
VPVTNAVETRARLQRPLTPTNPELAPGPASSEPAASPVPFRGCIRHSDQGDLPLGTPAAEPKRETAMQLLHAGVDTTVQQVHWQTRSAFIAHETTRRNAGSSPPRSASSSASSWKRW